MTEFSDMSISRKPKGLLERRRETCGVLIRGVLIRGGVLGAWTPECDRQVTADSWRRCCYRCSNSSGFFLGIANQRVQSPD
jgi:hypothetical protein